MTRFISCDWGTTRFRLRLIETDGLRLVAEHDSDDGIQAIAATHPAGEARRLAMGRVLERGLAALRIADEFEIPVAISGMASSTLGWQSLPYADLPAPIDGSTFRFLDFTHAGRRVRLVSGLRAASDVMRGEETELVGLFSNPARRQLAGDCTVVLPGTHSKHARLQAGRIVDFTTHPTGELYSLLSRHSTLCAPGDAIFDQDAFAAGVQLARGRPLSAALFQTRARAVLGLMPATHDRAFLSGVLIGSEVATLIEAPASRIVLAAGGPLAGHYINALRDLLPQSPLVHIPPAEVATANIAGHAKLLSLR